MKRHKTPIIEKKLATMNNTVTDYFDVESAFKNGDISDEEFLKFCGKLNEAYRVEKLRGDKLSAELEQMEGRAESAEEALLVKADEWLQWKARCEASEEMLEKFNDEQLSIIEPALDIPFWTRQFKAKPADVELTKEIIKEAQID